MKRKTIIICVCLIFCLTSTVGVFASSEENTTTETNPSVVMTYFGDDGKPIKNEREFNILSPKKQTINTDTTEVLSSVDFNDENTKLRAAAPGPILKAWKNYTVKTRTPIKKFKRICSATVNNKKSSKSTQLTCSIQKSAASSSTWSVNLSAEYEKKILAKVGGSYTRTKAKNEAVGLSSTITVPKGKEGTLTAYYQGYKTSGSITYNLIQNNRIIGTKTQNTTQTNHYKSLTVYFHPSFQ